MIWLACTNNECRQYFDEPVCKSLNNILLDIALNLRPDNRIVMRERSEPRCISHLIGPMSFTITRPAASY